MFKDIICTPSTWGKGAASSATFTGDVDGSDNWEYIKSIDIEGTAEAVVSENYPAFNWVNKYNTAYKTALGGKTFAWYMPSLAELCEVYKNRIIINKSLAKIYGLANGSGYADENLVNERYWSSSQSYVNDIAWLVVFRFGDVDSDRKYDYNRVCCLSGF